MNGVFLWSHVVIDDELDVELGHVNNEVYLHWMNQAAAAHSAALGWPAAVYLNQAQGWVVRRHEIEYLRPATAGEALLVRTWFQTMERASSWRAYVILDDKNKTLLARGRTLWAWINYRTGRPGRIPREVLGSFPLMADDPFADNPKSWLAS